MIKTSEEWKCMQSCKRRRCLLETKFTCTNVRNMGAVNISACISMHQKESVYISSRQTERNAASDTLAWRVFLLRIFSEVEPLGGQTAHRSQCRCKNVFGPVFVALGSLPLLGTGEGGVRKGAFGQWGNGFVEGHVRHRRRELETTPHVRVNYLLAPGRRRRGRGGGGRSGGELDQLAAGRSGVGGGSGAQRGQGWHDGATLVSALGRVALFAGRLLRLASVADLDLRGGGTGGETLPIRFWPFYWRIGGAVQHEGPLPKNSSACMPQRSKERSIILGQWKWNLEPQDYVNFIKINQIFSL